MQFASSFSLRPFFAFLIPLSTVPSHRIFFILPPLSCLFISSSSSHILCKYTHPHTQAAKSRGTPCSFESSSISRGRIKADTRKHIFSAAQHYSPLESSALTITSYLYEHTLSPLVSPVHALRRPNARFKRPSVLPRVYSYQTRGTYVRAYSREIALFLKIHPALRGRHFNLSPYTKVRVRAFENLLEGLRIEEEREREKGRLGRKLKGQR